MPRTPIARLRLVAILEGLSFLVLLGIAMPMKYLGGIDTAVKVVGWAHGALFVLLCAALLLAVRAAHLRPLHGAAIFVAALIPFGPFVIDGRLRREDERRGGA